MLVRIPNLSVTLSGFESWLSHQLCHIGHATYPLSLLKCSYLVGLFQGLNELKCKGLGTLLCTSKCYILLTATWYICQMQALDKQCGKQRTLSLSLPSRSLRRGYQLGQKMHPQMSILPAPVSRWLMQNQGD